MPFRYFFDHGARWGAQGRTGAYRGALGRSLAVAEINCSFGSAASREYTLRRYLQKQIFDN